MRLLNQTNVESFRDVLLTCAQRTHSFRFCKKMSKNNGTFDMLGPLPLFMSFDVVPCQVLYLFIIYFGTIPLHNHGDYYRVCERREV